MILASNCPVCGLLRESAPASCASCGWDFPVVIGDSNNGAELLKKRLENARQAWEFRNSMPMPIPGSQPARVHEEKAARTQSQRSSPLELPLSSPPLEHPRQAKSTTAPPLADLVFRPKPPSPVSKPLVPASLIAVGVAIAAILFLAIFSVSKKDTAITGTAQDTPPACQQDGRISFQELIWSWNDRDYLIMPGYALQARTEPRSCLPVATTLSQGMAVKVLRTAENTSSNEPNAKWYEVSLVDGSRRYIPISQANGALVEPGKYAVVVDQWKRDMAAQAARGNASAANAVGQDSSAAIQSEAADADTSSGDYTYYNPDRAGSVDPASRNMFPPSYPQEELRRGIQGTSILIVSIDADGNVQDVSVESSSGNRNLDREAVIAARRWSFNPEIRDGQQMASRVRVPIEFKLSDGNQAQTSVVQHPAWDSSLDGRIQDDDRGQRVVQHPTWDSSGNDGVIRDDDRGQRVVQYPKWDASGNDGVIRDDDRNK